MVSKSYLTPMAALVLDRDGWDNALVENGFSIRNWLNSELSCSKTEELAISPPLDDLGHQVNSPESIDRFSDNTLEIGESIWGGFRYLVNRIETKHKIAVDIPKGSWDEVSVGYLSMDAKFDYSSNRPVTVRPVTVRFRTHIGPKKSPVTFDISRFESGVPTEMRLVVNTSFAMDHTINTVSHNYRERTRFYDMSERLPNLRYLFKTDSSVRYFPSTDPKTEAYEVGKIFESVLRNEILGDWRIRRKIVDPIVWNSSASVS